MKRFLFILPVLLCFTAVYAHAQTKNPFSSLQFPIVELGNCGDVSSCKAYCDVAENESACAAYGRTHGLLPQNPSARTGSGVQQKLEALIQNGGGPGGCSTTLECRTYCSDSTHRDECAAFAQKNGLLTKPQKDEVTKTQKLQALISAGKGPGSCSSVSDCKTYCGDSAHRDECIAFAKSAGVVSPDEALKMSKIPPTGPGGCTSREACAAFCNDTTNTETCISFAKEHGVLKPGEDEGLRAGISASKEIRQAPPQAKNCLPRGVEMQLESGGVPSADVLMQVRRCFEQFRQHASSTDMNGAMMPPRPGMMPGMRQGASSSPDGRTYMKPPGEMMPRTGSTSYNGSGDRPMPPPPSGSQTLPPQPPPMPQTFPTSPSTIAPTILNLLNLPSQAAGAALSGVQSVYDFFFKF